MTLTTAVVQIRKKIRLILPPGFGLGLEHTEQFRLLGLRTQPLKAVSSRAESTSWTVGNPDAGYKFIAGKTGDKTGSVTEYIGDVGFDPAATGAALLRSLRTHQQRALIQVDKDPLVFSFKPRLVYHPPTYDFVANLDTYKPPNDKKGRLSMLVSLTSCLSDISYNLLSVRRGFRIVDVKKNAPESDFRV